jgi:glycosyltransferase involved in cell wall biosynthesis
VSRTDRVLLLDDPAEATPLPACGEQHWTRGSQARFVWQTWRCYRRQRHDLVLFDFIGLARAAAIPLPGFPPPRVAIFVHGRELEVAGSGSRARVLRHAELVLANSEFTADFLRQQLPELTDKIRVTPLCIDPERIELWESAGPAPAERRERAVLIVARMWREERGKGHDALIDAWPSVRREFPDARLWIVGEGDDAERLVATARDRGVADCVEFLGRVSNDELGSRYRRASVFAMPSRQEGFGLAFAEAMWWGLPCIGTTADAAGQVIVPGETGELVPYGDVPALTRALADLLSDPGRAARMGEAGRRRARERFLYARFRADLLTALELG